MGQSQSIFPEVRLITADDDIAELTSFLHRGYRALAERGMKLPASYQDGETTRRRISRGECYLAFHEKKLIGTITLNDMQHTHGSPWLHRPDVASFRQFTVEPSLRRNGIGSYLIQYVERRAAIIGAAELALDTAEPATDLIQFYFARGYRFIEYVRWDTENYRSVVMSKRISGSGLDP